MEQIKVSDIASEFELKHTLVISELKKIGVWVPSADTPVDQDIANRIRRRLQVVADAEQERKTPTPKSKAGEKKSVSAKPRKAARKTIKQLGNVRKARKRTVVDEAPPVVSPLASSLRPRKGKASYRTMGEQETVVPERVEVSIDDEPVIERVEAQVSAEALEALQPPVEELVPEPVSLPPVEETPAKEVTEKVAEEEVAAEPVELEAQQEQVEEVPTAEAPVLEEVEEKPKPDARKKSVLGPRPRKLRIIKRPEKKPELEPAPVPEPVKEPAVAGVKEKELPAAAAVQTPAPAAKVAKPEVERPGEIFLSETVTVKELSEKLQVKSKDVLRQLISRGVMATINQTLNQEVIEELCLAFDVVPNFVTFEESVIEEERTEDRPEDVAERAPVVTVMGHVDHGKTSLLDTIRQTNVAGGEAGGITQHIGAYHVKTKGKKIVFLDTPGHEAFTRMRARGAQATDIVVLVVAADDGVMPQTKEAIDHARAAGVPIIVAINKIDRAEADPDRVRRELSDHGLVPESWGGDTVVVEVSAIEGTNLDQLLEMILLVAELQELRANPERSASGVVLEAKLDKGRGTVATVLIQNGTLHTADSFIAGSALGKVRAMFDDQGKPVKKVGPSSAVEILGSQGIPQAGDSFQAVENAAKARQVVEYRQGKERERDRVQSGPVSLEQLYEQMQAGQVKELPIVLKADAQGSVEVLADTVSKLSTEKVKIRIIHRGVGAISDRDILLASASNAVVIGFNVRPEQNADSTAEREGVDVRLYTVIYEIAKEIQGAMVGLLEPTVRENYLGRAEVRDTFRVPKFGSIAGCYVLDGEIKRNAEVRLLRDNVVIFEGQIDSLRRFKEDANQVRNGYECGISIANFNDVKLGDIIEAFTLEEVAPELV